MQDWEATAPVSKLISPPLFHARPIAWVRIFSVLWRHPESLHSIGSIVEENELKEGKALVYIKTIPNL